MRCTVCGQVETCLVNEDQTVLSSSRLLRQLLIVVVLREVERGRLVRELLELHDVARQRARLVREDVFDLSQLLIDVRCLSLHLEVLVTIVHQHVEAHEAPLPQFDHFKRDEQRNWNEITVCTKEKPSESISSHLLLLLQSQAKKEEG